MGATCAKCCLCYCFKLCEFGERCRCCECFIRNCEPFCHFGDCCDVEEDNLPFTEENVITREGEDMIVYSNGDKYVGEIRDSKKHGYGELIRKDGTRLKGYFVEDQFCEKLNSTISSQPGRSVAVTVRSPGKSVTMVQEPSKSPKQAVPTDDRQELLTDT